MVLVNKNYTTISGDYYKGMTSEEAKQKGIYKKIIGIDFCDIDKNKDGVLSSDEIYKVRNNEIFRSGLLGALELGTGAVLMVGGILAEVPTLFTSTTFCAGASAMMVDGFTRLADCFVPRPGQTGVRGEIKKQITNIFVEDET